jgi:hypothetical protein
MLCVVPEEKGLYQNEKKASVQWVHPVAGFLLTMVFTAWKSGPKNVVCPRQNGVASGWMSPLAGIVDQPVDNSPMERSNIIQGFQKLQIAFPSLSHLRDDFGYWNFLP